MPKKEKSNATRKGKVKSSRVKKHKDRTSRRKTQKTSDCDCPEQSGSLEKEGKINCYVCDKEHDISSMVKYNDRLWFYWCSCNVSAMVYRCDRPTKKP
jgi:hypothetical protein